MSIEQIKEVLLTDRSVKKLYNVFMSPIKPEKLKANKEEKKAANS